MSQWGSADAGNNAPKFVIVAGSTADGNAAYGNVTVGAFIPHQAVGVISANAAEVTANSGVSNPGWIKVTRGTGGITTLTISAGGTGYANTDVVTASNGESNTTATLTTNSTGGITAVTLAGAGAGWATEADVVIAVANSTGGATAGSGANLVPTLGGRANRVQQEVLVALHPSS